MKVSGTECYLLNLPRQQPHRWRGLSTPIDVGSFVLVSVQTEDGRRGWGQATAMAQWGGDFGRYYGETPTTTMHVVNDHLWPVLAGRDPRDHRLLYTEMDKVVRGHPYAKQAVDTAILDLVAQDAGIPVYELLGGRRRTELRIGQVIGLMPVEEAVEEARGVVAEGVGMVKLKVGEDLERDLDLIRKVRAAVGPEAEIALDVNYGWGPISVAQRIVSRLSGMNIRYIEQPVAGIAAMAQLARRICIPLMADESVWTADDMVEIARQEAASLASIYTAKFGSLHNAMHADSVAHAHGIATNVNGFEESGVGTLAYIHLACAMASLGEACMLPITGPSSNRATQVAGVVYTDDVLAAPLGFHDGCLQVPDGPGLGVPVDLEKVEHYTVSRTSVGE